MNDYEKVFNAIKFSALEQLSLIAEDIDKAICIEEINTQMARLDLIARDIRGKSSVYYNYEGAKDNFKNLIGE